MTEEDRVGLINEIEILKQVDHPNIVKLIDIYEDATTFSLVLELMTGGEVSVNILSQLILTYHSVALRTNIAAHLVFRDRSKGTDKTHCRCDSLLPLSGNTSPRHKT